MASESEWQMPVSWFRKQIAEALKQPTVHVGAKQFKDIKVVVEFANTIIDRLDAKELLE